MKSDPKPTVPGSLESEESMRTMSQDRLNDLAMLSIEKKMTAKLDHNDLIDKHIKKRGEYEDLSTPHSTYIGFAL